MRAPIVPRMRHCLHAVIELANTQMNDPTMHDPAIVRDLQYYWGKYCELAQIDEQWHARRLEDALRAGTLSTIVDMAHMYLGHL